MPRLMLTNTGYEYWGRGDMAPGADVRLYSFASPHASVGHFRSWCRR